MMYAQALPSRCLTLLMLFRHRLWHTACLGKENEIMVFGGSKDNLLFLDTVSKSYISTFSLSNCDMQRATEWYCCYGNCRAQKDQKCCLEGPPLQVRGLGCFRFTTTINLFISLANSFQKGLSLSSAGA